MGGRFKGKKIAVLMGGMSAEREISLRTGSAVLKALTSLGYDAVGIDAGRDVAERITDAKAEAVFISLHGRYGEDGSIQGLLEYMGVPYTGSGIIASAVSMDKAASKVFFKHHGIPTPGYALAKKGFAAPPEPETPYIVKPSREGSTIGLTKVEKKGGLQAALDEAFKHDDEAIVESFISGRELTVAIIDGNVMPAVEIMPKGGLFDYAAKYTKGMTEFCVPAPLDAKEKEAVISASAGAYAALGCSGAARVDVMLDKKGEPYVLEVNTVPGMTELSLLPKAAAAAGISYEALVEMMLDGAGLKGR